MAEAVAAQVGYAALGIAIGEVLKLIKAVMDKTTRFKRQLQRLESTLTRVLPQLEKIRNSNTEIADTLKAEMERLITELNGAKELVLDYTDLRKRHVLKKMVKKVKIGKVLSNVDESVDRFLRQDVLMEIWEMMMRIEAHAEKVESLPGKVDRRGCGCSCFCWGWSFIRLTQAQEEGTCRGDGLKEGIKCSLWFGIGSIKASRRERRRED